MEEGFVLLIETVIVRTFLKDNTVKFKELLVSQEMNNYVIYYNKWKA